MSETIKARWCLLSTLVTASKVSAPEFTNRFNLYRSAEVNGIPAPGYSSTRPLKPLKKQLKRYFLRQWVMHGQTCHSRRKQAEGSAGSIFLMALLFVFLILAAQYESWKLPFSVFLEFHFRFLVHSSDYSWQG